MRREVARAKGELSDVSQVRALAVQAVAIDQDQPPLPVDRDSITYFGDSSFQTRLHDYYPTVVEDGPAYACRTIPLSLSLRW